MFSFLVFLGLCLNSREAYIMLSLWMRRVLSPWHCPLFLPVPAEIYFPPLTHHQSYSTYVYFGAWVPMWFLVLQPNPASSAVSCLSVHKALSGLLLHSLSLSRAVENQGSLRLLCLDCVLHSHLFTNALLPGGKGTLLRSMTPKTPNREAGLSSLLLSDPPTCMVILFSSPRQGSDQVQAIFPLIRHPYQFLTLLLFSSIILSSPRNNLSLPIWKKKLWQIFSFPIQNSEF